MNHIHLTDRELLALLVGPKTAEKIYRGSLLTLLEAAVESERQYLRISAAREFVRRALREELRRSDALSSPLAVRDFLRLTFAGKDHEVFAVLHLDAQHRVIEIEELFRGTLTQTSVYPREVVKHALRRNAAAVIFAHNHPSGVAEPSSADELLTRSLKQALALVDIQVLDHFIVAGNMCVSFAERGLL